MNNTIQKFEQGIILELGARPFVETVQMSGTKKLGVRMVTDTVDHTFAPGTAIADQLDFTSIDHLSDRLQGARLFVRDGKLQDYRYADYNGIIHNQATVAAMIQHIGVDEGKLYGTLTSGRKPVSTEFMKGSSGDGGKFDLHIDFAWSPFFQNLSSQMTMVRLICENGAHITSSLLQAKVPVLNRWEEHLAIASKQLETRAQNMFDARFKEMIDQRAPLSYVEAVRDHAANRLKNDMNRHDTKSRAILRGIRDMTDVTNWSNGTIDNQMMDSVSSAHAPTMPTHLSMFTLWNMVTELDSHTRVVDGSSPLSLQRLGNQMLFSARSNYAAQSTSSVGRFFNDPHAALMHHQL